ncbi:threonine synthase [Congregibacter sp.]|uniref:threonine synthase n=1 Tax=Congregibacter sp. TaxID=2744308 RepID=UPI0038592949
MRYISTRGTAPTLSFEEVLLTGLASDGGLYVPESLPSFSVSELEEMASLDYPSLAHRILLPFVEGAFNSEELQSIIDETYAVFRHSAVAPLVQLDHNQWVLELFHGPTLAFKDFALQLLGRLLDSVLKRRGEKVVIMGATSGDTGSAAIAGCQRCDNIDIFILHPHQRVSEVQRRQMTTLSGPTIHNLALQGNFDDCQAMVKASFRDQSFLPDGRSLVAVNSINWARIMAQIVYYFYAGLALGAPHRAAAYSVPTGNFGDIFAGYLASKMGLPVAQLMIATNRNDVLHRLLSSGDYARQTLEHTLSPSMDISVSSNFERLMFDLYDRDGGAIAGLMAAFDDGDIALSEGAMANARKMFASHRVDDAETLACISEVWDKTGYLLDPHSAIGYAAALSSKQKSELPWVTLATAHPAKFPDAIGQAEVGTSAHLPPHLADLFELDEHFDVLPNDIAAVQRFMSEHLGA